MTLRAELLTSSVTFDAEITADYGSEIHTFSVYCEGDGQGNLGFRVTAPESIADNKRRGRPKPSPLGLLH